MDGDGAYNFAMKFWSDSFADGAAIPANYAFCAPDPAARVKLSQNRNPHFAWSDLPKAVIRSAAQTKPGAPSGWQSRGLG